MLKVTKFVTLAVFINSPTTLSCKTLHVPHSFNVFSSRVAGHTKVKLPQCDYCPFCASSCMHFLKHEKISTGDLWGLKSALSFVGGLVGIMVGVLSSNATGTLFTLILPGKERWEAITTPTSIIGVLCFVILVGVAVGIFPAYKAAKLDPSEALRYQ